MGGNDLVCCKSFQFSHSGVVEDYVNPSLPCCRANAVSYFQTKYFIHVRYLALREQQQESTQQYAPDLYTQ